MSHKIFRSVTSLFLALAGTAYGTPAYAATFTVNGTTDAIDVNPGDGICATISGDCTLRAAIMEANAFAGDDVITIPVGTYTLSIPGTGEDAALNGDLDISSNLTINGADTVSTFVDGNHLDGVFQIIGTAVVTISGLTIQNGSSLNGGGINNAGTLILNDSILQNNFSDCLGSAVFNSGTFTSNNNIISDNVGGGIYCLGIAIMNDAVGNMTLNRTLVTRNAPNVGIYNYGNITLNNDNVTSNTGQGIFNAFGTMTLSNVTVSDNTGIGITNFGYSYPDASMTLNNSTVNANIGGGIYNNNANLIVNNSTINGNSTTTDGGGIFNTSGNGSTGFGSVTLNNSTVSGNEALGRGGGIFNALGISGNATVTLNNSTLSNNTALGSGGGISNTSVVILSNSVLAKNTASTGPDCEGIVGSSGYNLVGDISNCDFTPLTGDLTHIDPLLGPLQDNGGPTFTHALLPGSPAIDAGNPSGCTDQNGNLLTTDQRGVARPQGTRCDIGAFELEASGGGGGTEVSIDIKPGNKHNRIMIGSRGNASVQVAILSTSDFNAPQQVDKNSLTFGATGDENSLRLRFLIRTPDCRARDVNHDRIKDLVCSFLIGKTGFKLGDTVGILKGKTVDGTLLEGRDSVVITAPSYPSYPSYP